MRIIGCAVPEYKNKLRNDKHSCVAFFVRQKYIPIKLFETMWI